MAYRIGVTPEGVNADGTTRYGDIGMNRLAEAGIEWVVLRPEAAHRLGAEDVAGFDAILSFTHPTIAGDVVAAAPRLRHIARFGAGYDGIEVDGLTAAGVVLTNTAAAVRRPLATAGLTLLLNLALRFEENARAAREGRWQERGTRRGPGIAGRTIGVVGLGSVGSEFVRLAEPLGATFVATGQAGSQRRAAELGIEYVSRDELAARADYVVLTAALTASSFHLVDAAFLGRMKPSAYLVNIGRGPLVDQEALREAVESGSIAGAALDVLEVEPPAADEPLLRTPNLIVTPHTLCTTEDFVASVSDELMSDVIRASRGERPLSPVNPAVFTHWRGSRGDVNDVAAASRRG